MLQSVLTNAKERMTKDSSDSSEDSSDDDSDSDSDDSSDGDDTDSKSLCSFHSPKYKGPDQEVYSALVPTIKLLLKP